MESQQAPLILVMSNSTTTWAASLAQEYELQVFADIRDASKAIHNIQYNMIILDEDLFEAKTPDVIGTFKHHFPSMPIILLNNTGFADRNVLKPDVDAVLCKSGNNEELYSQIKVILNRSQRSYSRQRLNQQLHSLASLPRYLHSSTELSQLLPQAINWIRHGFHLYGVAVILKDEEKFHIYAGSEEVANRERLYEAIIHPGECDPFLWATRNRANQIYADISQNRWYVPIPVLHEAGSVAILPLTSQNTTLGAIGLYARRNIEITNEDLMLFEQFGSQLVAAMTNVTQQESLTLNLQFNQHLLQAWQIFSRLATIDKIKDTLASVVASLPNVNSSFVWFDTNIPDSPQELICKDAGLLASITDDPTYLNSLVNQLTHSLEVEAQPVLLQKNAANPPGINTLFQIMGTTRAIFVSVADSTHVLGGIVVGVAEKRNLTHQQADIIQQLGNTAGIHLERVGLATDIKDRNDSLETLLQSISEGVFFVDEENRLAFCNPQVAELTGVHASQVVGQDADQLLQAIAATASDPAKTYDQLRTFKQALNYADNNEREYPIIDISSIGQERVLNLEFVKISRKDGEHFWWAGVLRQNSRSGRPSKFQELLLNAISEGLRLPVTQFQNLANVLSNPQNIPNLNERMRLLNQSKGSLEQVRDLWDNFLEIYNLEAGRISFFKEDTTVPKLMEQVLNRSYANTFQRQITVDIPDDLPLIKVDMPRMGRSIGTIIQRAYNVTSAGSTVEITVEQVGQEVLIQINDAGPLPSHDQLDGVFGSTLFSTNMFASTEFYLAHEIVIKHGGRIWTESNPELGTAIRIALPSLLDNSPSKEKAIPSESEPMPELPQRVVTGAPIRTPNVIMFIGGKSIIAATLFEKLKEQYEILSYKSADDALEDVSTIHLDLVVIDCMLEGGNSFDVCTYIRKKTEVPIILVADKATDGERVQGLNAGADDFISKPVSNVELLARVQVIFKRQRIPERISEPLTIGKLYVDFARREVFVANQPVDLTRIEYDLFHVLVVNRGSVLTHKHLLEKVWGPEYQDETHYLWVNISRLRRKLESKDKTRYIYTQPGRGYFFDVI